MSDFSLVKFKLMRPGAQLPKRGTDGSGAFDFFVPENGQLLAGEKKLIPSGVAHDMPGRLTIPILIPPTDAPPTELDIAAMTRGSIPFRMQGILFDRSGLGAKRGIRLSFTGLIDNDYRGEIKLSIENTSKEDFTWMRGERLCQIAYALMYAGDAGETKELEATARGAGGFGSTGK